MKKKKAWKKVLYEEQDYPDNYTDVSFLDEMKKNLNTRMYDFRSVIFESGIVSQQLSTVVIFALVFIYLEQEIISPNELLVASILLLAAGCLFHYQVTGEVLEWSRFVVIPGLVFALSPILKTLTKTISTDTIYAMTTCMLLGNLLFHDYGAGVPIVSKAISLNAAIFASVCLGSRLSTHWHVYVYVMLAIEMFALFPEFRRDVKNWHRKAYILLTESLVVIATLLMLPISVPASFALVACHFSITFVFPAWMVRLQQMKNNIYGPWDEAMISR